MNARSKFFLILAALALTLGAASGIWTTAEAQAAQIPANCTQTYTIKAGDTLAKIAAAHNTSWRTLAEINKIENPNKIYTGTKICLAVSAATPVPTTPAPTTPAATAPTISIQSVVKDSSVTIKTANYPANRTFEVLMGAMGTRGINGVKVGTLESGTGGVKEATFNIPASLQGSARIAIRLQSTTGGYFSYNWFHNSSTTAATPAPTTPAPSPAPTTPAAKVPTIAIQSVVKDTSVTIKTANYPANRTFEVLMGPMGTRGVNGVKVGTLESGAGGAIEATFNIPASLQGSARIAIRLESTTGGYFSYNWFYNR
jgi:LysM repeat protein